MIKIEIIDRFNQSVIQNLKLPSNPFKTGEQIVVMHETFVILEVTHRIEKNILGLKTYKIEVLVAEIM